MTVQANNGTAGVSHIQKILGYILADKADSKVILGKLEARFPDCEKIPQVDGTSRRVLKSLYGIGFTTLQGLSMRGLSDCIADYEPLAGGTYDPELILAELVSNSQRQGLMVLFGKALADLAEGATHPDKIVTEVQGGLPSAYGRHSAVKNWAECAENAKQAIDEMVRVGAELETGIPDIDSVYQFRRRTLTTVGAKTSHGKTAFLLHVVCAGAQRGLRSSFSTHEDYFALPYRVASKMYKVPLSWFVSPHRHTEGEVRRAKEALEMAKEYNDLITPLDGISMVELEAALGSEKYDIIVVDYLQKYIEVHCSGEKKNDAAKVTSQLQDLAKKRNAFGLLGSQVRRPGSSRGEDGEFRPRRPTMGDLKESGDIENYTDGAFILYYPYKDNANEYSQYDYEVEVAKDKLGPCSPPIKVRFDGQTQTFSGRATLYAT